MSGLQLPAKHSILHRPLHQPSKAFETSAEKQYAQEQERLRAKAVKAQDTQERILRTYYPTPEDKQNAAVDIQQHMESVMAAKMSTLMHEAREDVPTEAQGPGVAKVLAVADDKPWLNPSLVYRDPAEEKLARRAHEQEVAGINRQLVAQASLQRSRAMEQEQQEARKALEEQTFWNLGSRPGDRYAPHGRRHVPAPATGPLTAPYAQDSSAAATPTSLSYGAGYGAMYDPSTAKIGSGYATPVHDGGGGRGGMAPVMPGAPRHNGAAMMSSGMEAVLQQQGMHQPLPARAAPRGSAATNASHGMAAVMSRPGMPSGASTPAMAALDSPEAAAPYATAANNLVYAPMAYGAQSAPQPPAAHVTGPYATDGNDALYQAHPPQQHLSMYQEKGGAAPYATAGNNAAYAPAAPPLPAHSEHNASAPFATYANNAAYTPLAPPAAHRPGSAGTAPFATSETDPLAGARGGRRYAARPVVSQGVPWATDADNAANSGIRPAVPHRGRQQGPSGSMSQVFNTGPYAPASQSGGGVLRPQMSQQSSQSAPWLR